MSSPIPADVALRLNYQTGMFLTADYMTLEQNFVINQFRLQNRYLYTPGVLGGMLVTQEVNTLSVSEGTGFDADGNFLILPDGGNPVTAPVGTNPFLVYAVYPDTSKATTPVVNQAALLGVAAQDSLPANAISLALITLDVNGATIGVLDTRVPVTSRLPAVLTAPTVDADSTPAATGGEPDDSGGSGGMP